MDTMESVIPELILYFTILAVTFLVGFSITFLVGMLIHRRFTESLIRYRRLPTIVISAPSILGGVGAVKTLFAWDQAEQKAQSERWVAFAKHMEETYPLELHVDLESQEPFTIVFTVPRDDVYWVDVFGYFAKETEYATRYGGEQVIEIRKDLQLKQGKNSFSFSFNNGVDLSTSRNLDLVVSIMPRAQSPHEQLLNTRKGILVPNSGQIELSEGIQYYSSDYDGCWPGIFHLACVKSDALYIDLSQ